MILKVSGGGQLPGCGLAQENGRKQWLSTVVLLAACL